MNTLKRVSVTVCLSFACGTAIAQDTQYRPSQGGDTGVAGIPAPSSGSVNESAKKAESENKKGQTMSYALGAVEIASGIALIDAEQYPPGAMLIMMGIMSFQQGGAHGGAAGQAALTAAMTDAKGSSGSSASKLFPEIGKVPDMLDQIKPGKNPNVSYDPKTGILKLGNKSYKDSDFASPASMAAAGFPPEAIAGAQAFVDKHSKKIAEKIGAFTETNGFAEGGGGGGSGSGSGVTYVDEETSSSELASTAAGAAGNFDSASMAGMSKDYNGDPIGVSADSIFDMMTRRYNVKKQQDSFFSEADALLNR